MVAAADAAKPPPVRGAGSAAAPAAAAAARRRAVPAAAGRAGARDGAGAASRRAAAARAAFQLSEAQARRFAGYSPAGQRLLAERLAATRELLERAPDERYAIELFITDNTDPARMERFLLRARELVPLEELFVIPMAAGGAVPPARRLRRVRQPRRGARRPSKRLPPQYQAGLPHRAAQLRRAARSNLVRSPKTPA